MFTDLTARTRLGAADLEPCFRRDRGEQNVEIRDWERKPAALALALMGWSPERIGQATGLHTPAVIELLGGRPTATVQRPAVRPRRDTKAARARRFAERIKKVDGRWFHPRAPHGKPSGYTNYGCRCTPCTAAHTSECSRYARKQDVEVSA
jgi:hypothetical protein